MSNYFPNKNRHNLPKVKGKGCLKKGLGQIKKALESLITKDYKAFNLRAGRGSNSRPPA